MLEAVAARDNCETVGSEVPELVALDVPAPLMVLLNREERLPVADTVDVKLRRDAVLAGDVVGVGT